MPSVSFGPPPPTVTSVDTTNITSINSSASADIILPVAAGQIRWNIGSMEARRQLFINGQRATLNVDYRIQLPFLDILFATPLDSTDELALTY